MDNKLNQCSKCEKNLSNYYSLWRHKKTCIGSNGSEIVDGENSPIPIYTEKDIKQLKRLLDEDEDKGMSIIDGKEVVKAVNPPAIKNSKLEQKPEKESGESNEDNRPDIVDCVGFIAPVDKTDDYAYNDNEDYYDKDVENGDDDDDDNDVQECDEDFDNALSAFITTQLAVPRKRLLELIGKISNGERLKIFAERFLNGNMKVTRELEDMLSSLKNSVISAEISMLINFIENENYRLRDVLTRLYIAPEDRIPQVLKDLRRERLISQRAFDRLQVGDAAHSLQSIIDILKTYPYAHDDVLKQGNGVTYLPGSMDGMKDKLMLLIGEYEAGNKTTGPEIVAILGRLRDKDVITENEFAEFNDWLTSNA